MPTSTLTVSAAARHLTRKAGVTVAPHAISTLFYKRKLDDELCPVVGRTRLIPQDYLPQIEAALREQGVLPAQTADAP